MSAVSFGWQPISTYPMTGPVLRVEVRMADGTVHADAHYAESDGEGFQPPFRGWFIDRGGYFAGIMKPVEWRHRPATSEAAQSPVKP